MKSLSMIGRPCQIVGGDSVSGQHHSEAARERLVPLLVGHLITVGCEPCDVFDAGAPDWSSLEEVAAAEGRVAMAYLDQAANEIEQVLVIRTELPIHPAEVVVLAVGIVVASLRATHFVAA